MSGKLKINPVSRTVPFDNSTNGFLSTNAQAAIEEIQNNLTITSAPPFSFGRSGVCTSGTFLQCETVPSNISGRWIYLQSAKVIRIFVSNESVITYTIDILHHDGNSANLTLVGSVTVTSAKGAEFPVNLSIPYNKQLAVRISPSSASNPKNVVCGLQLTGSLT